MKRGLLAATAFGALLVWATRASWEPAPAPAITKPATAATAPAMLSAVPTVAEQPVSSAPLAVAGTEVTVAPAAASAASASVEGTPVRAAETMAQARQHGDDRAPPLSPQAPDADAAKPTPWDTSDPTRYADYERRQQRQLEAAYVRAADNQLPVWRAALDEARARGASPEAIAAGEEKIRKLEAMRARLQPASSPASP